jgi:hypothetical protein
MFSFEFDERKSQSNSVRHGIEFVQAQDLWSDPELVEIPARTSDEPRFLVVGRIEGKPVVGGHHASSWDHPHHFRSSFSRRGGFSMKAKQFDAEFDDGKDVTAALDLSKARHPLRKQRPVNVDFPEWMIASLDREASRLGVTRQSIIKVWLAERLEQQSRAG